MSQIIRLTQPIMRNGEAITEITITDTLKQVGCLRGLKLWDVMMADVNAMIKLLPRVTLPALTEAEVMMLSQPDFVKFNSAVSSFFSDSSPETEADDEAAL